VVLAVAAAAAVLVVVLASWDRGAQSDKILEPRNASGLEARTTLSPRTALFGDTVRAHVDVVLDTTRVEPDSVRVAADFTPWEAVGKPERTQRDADGLAHVRTTFVLRCLTGACVLTGPSARLAFANARISFAAPGRQPGGESSIRAPWPRLLVFPRFAAESPGDSQRSRALAR
jgi:hypothetical protein